ncbi:MAG: Demethylrebeccamycin-D-glucose O-methyltransferase [Candidatus Anoxychlamydiales bacterium]|nr:Demethylrebeccamycin-D-glucose O-methyltransferase [Candidatus Anoxychlamydiales bacterium]
MAYIDFISHLHKKTKRDYLGRVQEIPKAEAATIAKKFDKDYWDGDRKYGYGGFKYDGRWLSVAEKLVKHYNLKPGQKVLDVGCGKGFLLYDLLQIVEGLEVAGIDISKYAIENSKVENENSLKVCSATNLPFEDNYFDLIISINTLHNLPCHDLEKALKEIQRVGKKNKYLVVESYRNEEEKVNLLYWQLTCESFYSPEEWDWWFNHCNYNGDHSFIYFE